MIKPELAKKFEDQRLDKLHNLIKSLYDTELFKFKFKCSILELNSLLEKKIIDQETYDNCIHAINGLVTRYNINNQESLFYSCCNCGKYFLEKNGAFLKTEIKTKYNLKYGASEICSAECFDSLDKILRDLDAGRY